MDTREVAVSRLLLLLLLVALLCAVWSLPALSQTADEASPPSTGAQYPPYSRDIGRAGQRDVPNEMEQKLEREREKKLNQERQAELKRDTDKLFQLATQLKQAVAKSNENTLSLEVIKKAGEIEKLAKSVRDKMRGQN
jgi:HPt (histidine-containing phosphotransfer) domain-containing protein